MSDNPQSLKSEMDQLQTNGEAKTPKAAADIILNKAIGEARKNQQIRKELIKEANVKNTLKDAMENALKPGISFKPKPKES